MFFIFQFWVGPFNQLKWRNNPLNPICVIISEIALFVNRSITETIRDMGLFIQLRINRSVCVHKNWVTEGENVRNIYFEIILR